MRCADLVVVARNSCMCVDHWGDFPWTSSTSVEGEAESDEDHVEPRRRLRDQESVHQLLALRANQDNKQSDKLVGIARCLPMLMLWSF